MDGTCHDTLSTVLPSLLRRSPGAVAEGVVLQLVVPDHEDCRYFYTFAKDDVLVTKGVSDKVDLTLSLVSEDLARFLDASLDIEHALRTRRMKVMGDESLLLALAAAVRGRSA